MQAHSVCGEVFALPSESRQSGKSSRATGGAFVVGPCLAAFPY